MQIIVYSKPGNCIQCTAVKRWLDSNGISYREENALDHMPTLEATGIRQMPIVDMGGEYFGGFDVGKLARIKEAIAG